MLIKVCVVLYIVIFTLSHKATADCPNNCSARGYCSDNFNCTCYNGFFSQDCSETAKTHFPLVWNVTSLIMISLYGICIIISVVVLIVNKIKGTSSNALMSANMLNSRVSSLICIFLLCIDTVIYYLVDPEGFDHSRVPLWVRDVIYMLLYPLLVTMFTIILTNWMIMYRNTEKLINTGKIEEHSGIKMHPALVTVNVLSYVFSATLVPIFILNPLNELSFLLNVIWLTFFSLVFLGITLGFFIYGRRLINLMPRELQRKLRRITRITEIQSCLYLTCWIINVAIFFYYHSPWSYLVSVLLFRLDLLAIISLVFVVQLKAYLTCCSCGSEDSYSYEAVSDRTYTSPKYASLVDAFSQSDKEATL